MSQRRSGCNNPAFCAQSETSLYDYEYVPEIDPDSPELGNPFYCLPRQVAPFRAQPNKSSSSDDSHGSVVVEERNNRRVTTIYEKKPKVFLNASGYENNISMESINSEDANLNRFEPTLVYKMPKVVSSRHRYEELEIPKQHRYAELEISKQHRYAEIDQELETEGVHFTMRKPRVPSPVFHRQSSPVKFAVKNFAYETSSPVAGFEMTDFSPPQDYKQRQPPVGALADEQEWRFQSTPVKTEERKKINTPVRSNSEKGPKLSARRNISSAFTPESKSPYRPTTEAISNRNTAIITPILQRKFQESRIFESRSQAQNNLNKMDCQPGIKRKSSTVNFQQERTPRKTKPDSSVSPLNSAFRKIQYQSPAQSPENLSNLNKSRISLIESLKTSFTTDEEEYSMASSGCLILAAVVQLLAGIVTCVISFYLLSKLGRQYYLDMGALAGFISMVLGGLGLRSLRWRWLLNGNYVLSYIALAGFSLLNAACLVLIISVRPATHDPFLNVCVGIIGAVSVIVIVLSVSGFIKSGCCKAPLDNRVATTSA